MNLKKFKEIILSFFEKGEKPFLFEERDSSFLAHFPAYSVCWHKKVGFTKVFDNGEVIQFLKLNQKYYNF
jgi:hypothetical protein